MIGTKQSKTKISHNEYINPIYTSMYLNEETKSSKLGNPSEKLLHYINTNKPKPKYPSLIHQTIFISPIPILGLQGMSIGLRARLINIASHITVSCSLNQSLRIISGTNTCLSATHYPTRKQSKIMS